jgi:hypothetical protein
LLRSLYQSRKNKKKHAEKKRPKESNKGSRTAHINYAGIE